jgi:hypothetical protein
VRDKIKAWLRRWAIRQLIKLVDRGEERLQEWQVSLRKKLAAPVPAHEVGSGDRTEVRILPPAQSSFQKWEARRSGVAVITKKQATRRRRLTAADFDRRFA